MAFVWGSPFNDNFRGKSFYSWNAWLSEPAYLQEQNCYNIVELRE